MKKIYLTLFLALPIIFSAQSVQGTWKLAQQAGALAVGPNQGDGSWWSNSANDLTVRDCFFDDSITFDANGNMMHYMDGSTWVEGWQGVASEQCGTPVAPHDGSGTYTYTFANNQLTVNGLGAHIGLPKAINGGEINDPANAVSSITYEISFGANGELIADIQSAGGGTGWWRFIYTLTNTAPPPPPPAHDVTFVVHTDNIAGNVSSDGIYIGGGFVGGNDALALSDVDGDGVWEGTMNLPAAGGHFTILNGNCSDWSCKEDISGLPCADPGAFNDRTNLLGGFTQDTTLVLQFGDCSTPSGNTGIIDNAKDEILIYPNPTSDVINISSTSTITDYNMYNMIGNKVMSSNVNASIAIIDMSTLTKGVYFVEVNQNGLLINKRIIKK
tara:strand:+ start:507 stop:1664 length:1158 start_codon:yes stop_codon:yes gene_type:complete